MKPRVRLVIGIALFICLCFSIAWISFLNRSVVNDDQGFKYTVAEGASIKSVINELSSLGLINHPLFYQLYVELKGNKHELKAGEYLFPKGTTPASMLTQITTGSGILYHSFTIVAGWNFKHLRDALAREPNLQHTITSLSDAEIMRRLGHPELNPEGWFYPDTYYFVKDSSDLALLKRSFHMMRSKLNDIWKQRELGLPYQTLEETLIAASLIEKETGIDQERPVIAGVIVNRLRKNMLLQMDPTVIYAMGPRYNGVIYKSDLLVNSPYNTYLHKGLPPTPIAIPGMRSIMAALHPEHHRYYFFVAKNDHPENGHQFSETIKEHNQAVFDERHNLNGSEYFNDNLVRSYIIK